MAAIEKANQKWLNDPLYTPVNKFLQKRLADLEAAGESEELNLARARYTGLLAGDLVIENPISFPDGKVQVCFVTRKTGFGRADVVIEQVEVEEIVADFELPVVEIADLAALQEFVKTNTEQAVLLRLLYKDTYGILLTKASAQGTEGAMKAFGDLFFKSYDLNRPAEDYMDYVTLEAGTVTINDPACGEHVYPLFIQEDVLDYALTPELILVTNQPIITHRGEDFEHTINFFFDGVNVTTDVTTVISTGNGYVIPERNGNTGILNIQTIYGSSTASVEEEIIIRGSYPYKGRFVTKTFRIPVTVEKDAVYELTFNVNPETIEGRLGDSVFVAIQPLLRGEPVRINVPPAAFKSTFGFIDLKYSSTGEDGWMYYEGVVTRNVAEKDEPIGDYFTQEFSYTEPDSRIHKAPVNINGRFYSLKNQPKLDVVELTNSVVGELNDVGIIRMKVMFMGEEKKLTDLGLRPGIKGNKGLIEFTVIHDDYIEYKLIKNSGSTGVKAIEDVITNLQLLYITGVVYKANPTINVTVRYLSVVAIVPNPVNPVNVVKYQDGAVPFKVMIDGVDKTVDLMDLALVSEGNYIRFDSDNPKQWRVMDTPAEGGIVKVKFTWKQEYDDLVNDMEYDAEFDIEKWEGGNVGIYPRNFEIDGVNRQSGNLQFKTFYLDDNISPNAKTLNDQFTIPDNISVTAFAYVAETKFNTLSYVKDLPGAGLGQIVVTDSRIENPVADDIGFGEVDVNVTQAQILELVSMTDKKDAPIDDEVNIPIKLQYAGVEIDLDDPLLRLELAPNFDVTLVKFDKDSITLKPYVYRAIDSRRGWTGIFRFFYNDNGVEKRLNVNFDLTLVYQPVEITYSEDPVKTRIWDVGSLGLTLKIGSRDITGNIYEVEHNTNKYISIGNNQRWEVINADTTEAQTTIPVSFRFNVDFVLGQRINKSKTFIVEPWDQITFRFEYEPKVIEGDSGMAGNVTGKFIYRRTDISDKVVLLRAESSIPRTFTIGTTNFDQDLGFVIPYITKLGGDHPMKLVVQNPDNGATVTLDIETKITWPHDLNLDDWDSTIKGYWPDDHRYKLILNYDGIPLDNTDPRLVVSVTSGVDEPLTYKELLADALMFNLKQGGDKDTDYSYTVNIDLKYTHDDGRVFSKNYNVPSTIRVSDILIGNNPTETVFTYDIGTVRTKLVDEQGKNIQIDSIVGNGTSEYISFVSPDGWYVKKGIYDESAVSALPIKIGYTYSGKQYTIETEINFIIRPWDGKDFKGTATPTDLEGDGGDGGKIKFEFKYKGYPVLNPIYQLALSTIPSNILFNSYDTSTNTADYTLISHGNENMKLIFDRPGGAQPPVIDVDRVELLLTVKSVATDKDFTVESGTSTEITTNWNDTAKLKVVLKYGDRILPCNAPGLTFAVGPDGDKSIVVSGTENDNVILKGIRSNGPNTSGVYKDTLVASFNLGDGQVKTVDVPITVTIVTGSPVVIDITKISGKVWDIGSLTTKVEINGKKPTIDKIRTSGENKYLEITNERSWEFINSEASGVNETIQMTITYVLDGEKYDVTYGQDVSIDQWTGSRFKVVPSAQVIDLGLDRETIYTFAITYKDKPAGSITSYRQDKSTIPEETTIVRINSTQASQQFTFKGVKVGRETMKMVWYAPGSGENPLPRDIIELDLDMRVLGDLQLEVLSRDNLIADGVHGKTDVYGIRFLFGGVPIDNNDPALSIASIDQPTASNNIAGLMKGNALVPTGVSYRLEGACAPGRTITVSDFITFRYTYAGSSFTTKVEIPISYTTPAPLLPAVGPYNTKIWTNLNINPNPEANGVKLGAATLLTVPNTDAFLEWKGGTNVMIRSAHQADVTLSSTIKFFGKYRIWEWEAEKEVSFNIAAWDQKEFRVSLAYISPNTPAKPHMVGDLVLTYHVYIEYRDVRLPATGATIDLTGSTLHELATPVNYRSTSGNPPVAGFDLQMEKSGSGILNIKFIRLNHGNPEPVQDVDYTFLDIPCDIIEKPLTITSRAAVSGGNKDLVNIPITIIYGRDNVSVNNPNISVLLSDETVLKLTGNKTATTVEAEITAPIDPVETKVIDITITYTTPDGKVINSTVKQTVNVTLPSDYPVFVQSTSLPIGATPWEKSKTLNGTIRSSNVDVTDQCVPLSLTGDTLIEMDPDYATTGNWWWCTSWSPGTTFTMNYAIYKVRAPFRGGTVVIDVARSWRVNGYTIPFVWIEGTLTGNHVLDIGDTGEFVFDLTFKKSPGWTDGELSISKSGNYNGQPLSYYFDIGDKRVENGKIIYPYTVKNVVNGTCNIAIVNPNATTDTANKDYRLFTYLIYGKPKVGTNTGLSNGVVFTDYPVPFTIISGVTNITNSVSISKIESENNIAEVFSNPTNAPSRFRVINGKNVPDTYVIKFFMTIPANAPSGYPGETMEVSTTISLVGWDQIRFKSSSNGNTSVTSGNLGSNLAFHRRYYYEEKEVHSSSVFFNEELSDLREITRFVSVTDKYPQGPAVYLKGIKPGKELSRIVVSHISAKTNPVVQNDNTIFFDVNLTVNQTLPVITTIAQVSGGNQDLINCNLKVTFNGVNYPINSPKLSLSLENENTFKLTGVKTATSFQIQVTANLGITGVVNVPVKITLDPSLVDPEFVGFTSQASYNQPINLTNPQDYPVATVVGASPQLVALWESGVAPFTIKSGTTDITSSCVVSSVTGGYLIKDPKYPLDNKSWWCTNPPDKGQIYFNGGTYAGTRTYNDAATSFVINCPYRETMVALTVSKVFRADVVANLVRHTGSVTPATVSTGDGLEGELVFTLLYNGRPNTDATLDLSKSTPGIGAIFTFGEPVIDGEHIRLPYTTHGQSDATFSIAWTANKDTSSTASVVLKTIGTPVADVDTSISVTMWNNYPIPFKITTVGKDITTACTIKSITTPKNQLAKYTTGANVVPRFEVLDGDVGTSTYEAIFEMQLPAGYTPDTLIAKCTINAGAYPAQNQFYVDPIGSHVYSVELGKAFNVDNRTIYRDQPYHWINVSINAGLSDIDGMIELTGTAEGPAVEGGWTKAATIRHTWLTKKVGKRKVKIAYMAGTGTPIERKNLFYQEIDLEVWVKELLINNKDIGLSANSGEILEIPTSLTLKGIGDIPPNSDTATCVIDPNPYITLVERTATSIKVNVDYQNAGPDFDVTPLIKWTVTNGGQVYSTSYNQKITISGSGEGLIISGVNPINAEIWDKSIEVPFETRLNGVVLNTSEITTVGINSPTNKVGLYQTRGWYVVNAEIDPSVETVRYTITVNDNGRIYTAEQDVVFNIAGWNQNPFEVSKDGFESVSLTTGSKQAYNFIYKYKGEPINDVGIVPVLSVDKVLSNGLTLINVNMSGPKATGYTWELEGLKDGNYNGKFVFSLNKDGTHTFEVPTTFKNVGILTVTPQNQTISVYNGDDFLVPATLMVDTVDYSDKDSQILADIPVNDEVEVTGKDGNSVRARVLYNNNTTEDYLTNFLIRWTVNTDGGNKIVEDYRQDLIIRPDTISAEDIPALSVNKGENGEFPLIVKVNGQVIPTSGLTISGISEKSLITIGENGSWEVTNAETVLTQDTVSYTINYQLGQKTLTLIKDVNFNVAALIVE